MTSLCQADKKPARKPSFHVFPLHSSLTFSQTYILINFFPFLLLFINQTNPQTNQTTNWPTKQPTNQRIFSSFVISFITLKVSHTPHVFATYVLIAYYKIFYIKHSYILRHLDHLKSSFNKYLQNENGTCKLCSWTIWHAWWLTECMRVCYM